MKVIDLICFSSSFRFIVRYHLPVTYSFTLYLMFSHYSQYCQSQQIGSLVQVNLAVNQLRRSPRELLCILLCKDTKSLIVL